MAKKYDFDEEDGVWRTIGGRRVFIKNGQSLSDAMKESGKFKSAKKKKKPELDDADKEYIKNVADAKDDKELEKADAEYKEKTGTDINDVRLERDAKDVLKTLNDEGSDFSFDEDVKIEDGKIKTSVGVFMPDERGYVERELEIPIDKNETYDSLEEKMRDWEDRHRYADNFDDPDFEEPKNKEDDIFSPKPEDWEDINHWYNDNPKEEWEKQDRYEQEWKKYNTEDPDYNSKNADKSSDYRNKITDVAKKSKEDNVTLDVETGKPVNFDKGYSVSFQQSTDNYTDEEYAEKVAECRDKCDGKVYAGKYGGDAEASFHTDNLDDAVELMHKYNQESIYDWQHGTLIMNDKYDASKNQTNYKEKSTNDYMNDKIRKGASKGKVKEDLPKKTEIKTQGTSNRKEVSENIQAHILDYYDSPEDFVQQMDAMNYLPTKWHAGEELAKGGSYMVYYDEQRDFLDSLKINPKGKEFSDDRVFQTYTSLIGRESAKLYDRLKKNEYRKYMKQHPGSKMTFSEYKDMKKGGE